MEYFNVVPLCSNQLRDVNPSDILCDGLYRKCNVYKSGGGYDRFPAICSKRLNKNAHEQFVVQLYGCPLRCPYCYVTPDGIFGKYQSVSSEKLISDFNKSECEIFHLMGGAPALYMNKWDSIIDNVPIFHSDFLLVEGKYDPVILDRISKPNALYAVSIKGYSEEDYLAKTGVKVDFDLLKYNLSMLKKHNVNFYITFTGMTDNEITLFKNKIDDNEVFRDSFGINLIKYEAIK